MLIVCSHFPPANATGARRPYHLARHLADRGHRVSVICKDGCDGTGWNMPLHGITVHRIPADPLAGVQGPFRRWLARKFAGGATPHVLWRTIAFFVLPQEFDSRAYVSAGLAARTIERPDVIVASGPGWSALQLAARLAVAWGSTLVLDHRDPWTVHADDIALRTSTWYGAGLVGRLKRRHVMRAERRVLRHAHGLTAATGPLLENARAMAPHLPARRVMNGVPASGPITAPPEDGPLTLLHTGRLYHEQDWGAVVRMLHGLHADGVTEGDLQVVLAGPVSEDREALRELRSCAERTGLVRMVPRMAPHELVTWQARADLFLHMGFRGKRGIIPLKLLEYFGSGRPIVNLSSGRTEIEELIERSRTGTTVATTADLRDLLLAAMAGKRARAPLAYSPDRAVLHDMGWEPRMAAWRAFILEVHARHARAQDGR